MSINSIINELVLEQFNAIDAKIFLSMGINPELEIKCCIDKNIPKPLIKDLIVYLQLIHDDKPISSGDYTIFNPNR